jgi:hypothetical protein
MYLSKRPVFLDLLATKLSYYLRRRLIGDVLHDAFASHFLRPCPWHRWESGCGVVFYWHAGGKSWVTLLDH